ncbi:hypothetical protein VTO42DRAFT_1117 [Malbranchea cinnamomea]
MMSESLRQASPSEGKPSGLTSQPSWSNEAQNQPHQQYGFEAPQTEVSTLQNDNTPSAQVEPLQSTAAEPVHSTSSTPTATLQVHEITTVHSHPSDTSSVPTSTTFSDEKREIAMPATRGHTAAANNAATAAANDNIAASMVPQVRPGGAPVRTYLNEKVVPYLLEGMKALAKDQPQDPLRVLGEYLIQKSKEAGENLGSQTSG